MQLDFSKNLRWLCADSPSVAHVCREIGINRQQFNRYLNGSGMPSAHNVRRIANYFDVPESDLLSEHGQFRALYDRAAPKHQRSPSAILNSAFSDQARNLRRYLGFYHAHLIAPAWNNMIMRNIVWFREKDGYVVSHTFEQARSNDGTIRQRIRYSGLVTYRGNRIYVIEKAHSDDGFLSETVLFPAHRQQINLLHGTVLGVSARPDNTPFATKVVWKRLNETISARSGLRETGVFARNSTRVDPAVRRALLEGETAQV